MNLNTLININKKKFDLKFKKLLNNKLDTSILSKAMYYGSINGGKRIRPFLVMESAKIAKISLNDAFVIASSIECIHSYSLIHDDLPSMDDDELRRGNPTTHKKFDEATAILAGDALQPLAFELISTINTSADNKIKMIKSLSKACGHMGMVGGQIKDIHSEKILNLKSLDLMHSEKTGKLIQSSLETSGILVGLSKSTIEALKEFGAKIGLAFQIQDDIIDIESPSSLSGKDQGSDVIKDKITYPSLVGLEHSKKRAIELSEEAKKILQPISKNTDNLSELADYIVSRKT